MHTNNNEVPGGARSSVFAKKCIDLKLRLADRVQKDQEVSFIDSSVFLQDSWDLLRSVEKMYLKLPIGKGY